MLAQAFALALAASIYPPAVAAVIALGRGSQVRSRVAIFVLAAVAITYASGTLMLFVLVELGATGSPPPDAERGRSIWRSALLLVLLAVHLRRRRPAKARVERTVQNRALSAESQAGVRAGPDALRRAVAHLRGGGQDDRRRQPLDERSSCCRSR